MLHWGVSEKRGKRSDFDTDVDTNGCDYDNMNFSIEKQENYENSLTREPEPQFIQRTSYILNTFITSKPTCSIWITEITTNSCLYHLQNSKHSDQLKQ